jgi:hypothetical protein
MSKFLDNQNVKILWDLIIDIDIVKTQSNEFKEYIFQIFKNNITQFYEVEKNNCPILVDMNKKYIMLMLDFIKKTISMENNKNIHTQKHYSNNVINTPTQKNKIKIHDINETNTNELKELVTFEDIQNDKRSQFDKDLSKYQAEFTSAMTLPTPTVPDFTDNIKETPINEMEKAIQEITSQRNYDIEQINKSYHSTSDVNTWLKPQETSIKSEKLPLSKKNVSWGENEIQNMTLTLDELPLNEMVLNENDNNIFKKLKSIKKENIDDTFKERNVNETNGIEKEDKMQYLEDEIKKINNKIEKLFDLINKKVN